MKSDTLFESFPETVFKVTDTSTDDLAAYTFSALEIKRSLRMEGILVPNPERTIALVDSLKQRA